MEAEFLCLDENLALPFRIVKDFSTTTAFDHQPLLELLDAIILHCMPQSNECTANKYQPGTKTNIEAC